MNLLPRFTAALSPPEPKTIDTVRAYLAWQAERLGQDFQLHGDADDVAVRSYLAHLRTTGASRAELKQATQALRRLYGWALAEGLITESPFNQFDFDRPILARDQIRRRQAVFSGDARERELGHLRALNHLADRLNRSLDIQAALDVTLETLVEVMALKTAWAFVLTEAGLVMAAAGEQPSHGFALAAACRLPPGLEADRQRFLRQPPDCHCQFVLREGHMVRAVNVVECTRLQDSAAVSADNEGLLFHASVPLVVEGRPAGIMNFATDEWQFLSATDLQLLSAAGALVSGALERARLFEQVRAAQARLELELRMAHQVQASLLPKPLPEIPGYDLAAEWRAARETAGDFYDVFPLPDSDRWVIVVGDVSDKGASAALYMAMTRSLLRSRAEAAAGPAALLNAVNRALASQSTSSMFVTLFCAVLDPGTGALAYANAGHNPPVLRRVDGSLAELRPTGPLAGVFAEFEFGEAVAHLNPGEALVAYTDGLTEAFNNAGEEFGPARLRASVAARADPAQGVVDRLLDELNAFCESAPQADDVTLAVLIRLPKSVQTSEV